MIQDDTGKFTENDEALMGGALGDMA